MVVNDIGIASDASGHPEELAGSWLPDRVADEISTNGGAAVSDCSDVADAVAAESIVEPAMYTL